MDTNKTTTPSPAVPPRKNRGLVRTLGWVLLVAFVAIQFFQPHKNNQSMDATHDIATVVPVPDSVHQLLKAACYDCHSNHTNYPWYSNIQPLGWWLKDHIEEGKGHLNFQEFALVKGNARFPTPADRQIHKLEEVIETVKDGEMPLKSYTFIHGEARLSQQQLQSITAWAQAAMDTLKARPKNL